MADRTLGGGLGILALLATVTFAPAAAAGAPHVHDGFYLRLGAGFGYLSDSVESESVLGNEIQATVTGVTGVGEVGVGGAVSPGLFLGGGLWAHWLPGPKADDVEWGALQWDAEFDSGSLLLVGPFIDYYFDPTGGLHLQASLGLALGALGEGSTEGAADNIEDMSGTGLGGMIGIGHEWWVGDQWSLGLLGRFTVAGFSTETEGNVDWSHLVIAPAVLFTASMN